MGPWFGLVGFVNWKGKALMGLRILVAGGFVGELLMFTVILLGFALVGVLLS